MAIPAIDLSSLNGSNGFRLDGEVAEDLSGFSVGNAGDINGDGFDDVIVHALTADPSSSVNYVVFGKASGFDATMNLSSLDGSNGFRLEWKSTYDFAGFTVSSAGDVNGDGFDDLIVSANVYGNGSDTDYIVFGKASGFSATIDQSSLESSLDGNNGFRLQLKSTYDVVRLSVSNAGDVNGDGFGDLIVGANYADYNGTNSGSSYVVFGKASGFSATLDLSSLDGSNGFRLDGETEFDQSGRSVSSAGDVNGDGFDDVIVGAPFANNDGGYYTDGASYVVFGKASGFNSTLNLSSLDGSNGFRLDGAGDQSGSSVRSAGDVNGDGFNDVLVGARVTGRYGMGPDTSYVVFGKASGFDAAMNLSRLDGYNGFRLEAGLTPYDDIAFNSAGDINGDGFDDLIVGEGNASQNGDRSGSSYVVFGKDSGFAAILDVPSLDSIGLRLDGVAAGDISGNSVSSAGDVNNDGFDDVIIGAFGADPNGESSGSSYVVFGRKEFTDDETIRGTPGDDVLIGTPGADRFEAGDGNDSMSGRGGADEFLGEAGNDYIRVSDLNFESVDGGIGNDVLALGGSGLNLNLTDMSDKISGIETIRLFGTGDNTLTLRAADVLNLSDTSNTLRVNGNEGDRIVGLSQSWGDGGVHGDFHTFFNDAAVLLVGGDVATDFV